MAAERFGSKTDVIVKLVLVFFIALLSFSIGTFVGKKFSDNQYKLAQLEPTSGHEAANAEEHGEESRGIASISPEAGEVKPEKALSDDEIAKLAEEFVTDDTKGDKEHGVENPLNDKKVEAHTEHAQKEEEHPAEKHEEAKAEHAEHKAEPAHEAKAESSITLKKIEQHETHEISAAAERTAHGKSPVVANKPAPPSRIPSSLPKEIASSAIGKFTVQVASYGTEKEAQVKSADLKEKGFSAFYVSAKVKGATWYRVSVGLFTTQKEAEAYKKDLVTRAKVTSALVQKITNAD